MRYKQELALVKASHGQAGRQAELDKLDAGRYRKYRAMVIARLSAPVSPEQFDADIDAAANPVEMPQRPTAGSF